MDSIPTPPDPFESWDRDSLAIGDLPPFLADVFFLPGNWLLWAVTTYTPAIARFLEIGPDGYGGVLAGSLSAIVWIASIVLFSIGYRAIRDLDDALTRSVVQGWADLRRRVRIGWTLLIYRARARRAPKAQPGPVELREEIELDAQTLRLLRAHADIGPGYALPVSEAAAAAGCRAHEAQRILKHLKALQLVRPALGGPDGETAHVLTPAGRAFLLFKQMMPAAAPATRAG